MRFLICKQQYGGYDMNFYFVEAESQNEALEHIIWPEGRNEYSALEGEDSLSDIYIIPAESVYMVDVQSIESKIEEDRKKAKADELEAKERELLAKLQDKYNK